MALRLRSLTKECLFITFCLASFDLFVLPIACRGRCVYSDYFGLSKQEIEEHVQADQKLEADKAIEYFRILNATKSLQYYDKRLVQELDVLIAVITVARAKSSYLKQTVASIDNQIKAGEAANMAVIVCDASSETAVYPEAVELSSYLPVLKIYGKNLMVEPNWKQVRVKEKLDYVRCLQKVTEKHQKAKILLVLEDDVMAIRGGLSNLNKLLKFKLIKQRDWLIAKLFYPNQYKGYELTIRSIVELIWVILLSSAVLFFLLFLISPRKRLPWETIVILLLITAAVSLIIIKLGRQFLGLHIFRFLLPYNYLQSEGSASCALLYPMTRVPEVISYLSSVEMEEDFPIDLALGAFSREHTQLKSFRVEEEFFKHIGYYSSLHGSHKRALDYYTP